MENSERILSHLVAPSTFFAIVRHENFAEHYQVRKASQR
jgi:hypothetical protein